MFSLAALDDSGTVHQVMVRPTVLGKGKTRCQTEFLWRTSIPNSGVRLMSGSDEEVNCILCLGHWSAP